MRTALFWLLSAATLAAAAPLYSSEGIVNAANSQAGPLAPNTLASIYGTNLSYVTRAIGPADIQSGFLPTLLSGTGVHVTVNGLLANMFYVSPLQINFLVPALLLPGDATVQVTRDGLAGPAVKVKLASTAPALFENGIATAIAARPDGSLISADQPAGAGDWVILYATGLGQTTPAIGFGEIPAGPAMVRGFSQFGVSLDGVPVAPENIGYAGAAPGFGGVYQINLRLPDSVTVNPEIRIGLPDSPSAAGVRIAVR